MTPRRRAILIVVLALLLLGLIIFAILWFWPKPGTQAPDIQEPTLPTTTTTPATAPVALNPLNPPVVKAAPGSTAAVQIAELFAERYGSYSNQGDFQNLTDLLPVMTAKYRAETEAYLATAATSDTSNYQGVTSVKISSEVRAYSQAAGTATVAVLLQQQKTAGTSPTPAISYRSLRMELKLVGTDWKVDSATWEN
jgi:hypothetical protein